MPFAYYYNLSRKQQRIYDQSDAVHGLKLPAVEQLQPLTLELRQRLAEGKRGPVRVVCQKLSDGICRQLQVDKVKIKVLDLRPDNDEYVLHGFYMPADRGNDHTITVWMRTSQRKQVVAFKTFLRTLLHELCHHLDYEYLKLDESYHTEGFYKRESSLFHQIVHTPGLG